MTPRALVAVLAVPPLTLLAALVMVLVAAMFGYDPLWKPPADTTLVEAAYAGDPALVLRLLEAGADPYATGVVDGVERSVAEAAVVGGDMSTIRIVLTAAPPRDRVARKRLVAAAVASRLDKVMGYVREFLERQPVQ